MFVFSHRRGSKGAEGCRELAKTSNSQSEREPSIFILSELASGKNSEGRNPWMTRPSGALGERRARPKISRNTDNEFYLITLLVSRFHKNAHLYYNKTSDPHTLSLSS